MNQLVVSNQYDVSDISQFLPGYRPAIRAFCAWMANNEPEHYPSAKSALKGLALKIDAFLRTEADRKPATVGLHRVALKKWLIAALGAEYSPPVRALIDQEYRSVRKVQRDKSVRPGKFLKRYEIEKLIESVPRRYALIVKLLFVTGLRVSELCGIRLSNCVEAGDHVDVTIIGKRAKERTVQVPIMIFREVKSFFGGWGSPFLFSTSSGRPLDRRNIYAEIRRHGEKILGRKVTPHMMRHSLATYLINERDVNLGAVSKLLGHSKMSLTADLYCHGLPAFGLIFDPVSGELK